MRLPGTWMGIAHEQLALAAGTRHSKVGRSLVLLHSAECAFQFRIHAYQKDGRIPAPFLYTCI